MISELNKKTNPSNLRLSESNGNHNPKQLAAKNVPKRIDGYILATTGKPDPITRENCEEYASRVGASFGQNLNNPGPGCTLTADLANVRYNSGKCQNKDPAGCDCSPTLSISLLCELDSDHTPLETSRSNGRGGRNDPSVGSRAVLCENGWTEKSCTFDVLKEVSRRKGEDKMSNYVLFWDSNVVPLGDIQDKFFKDGKPSFFTVGNPSNGDKCKAHAPWLLVERGSPFA
eukprot:g4108.t1